MTKVVKDLIDYRSKQAEHLNFEEVISIREQIDRGEEYLKVNTKEYIAIQNALHDEKEWLIAYAENLLGEKDES